MKSNDQSSAKPTSTRRDFLVRSAALSAGRAGGLSLARSAHAAGGEELRIALVGCGRRQQGNVVEIVGQVQAKLVRIGLGARYPGQDALGLEVGVDQFIAVQQKDKSLVQNSGIRRSAAAAIENRDGGKGCGECTKPVCDGKDNVRKQSK